MATKRTPTGRKVGRPSMFTEERRNKIIEYLTAGNYIDTACAAAGISTTTYYNWMERGKNERDRITATSSDPLPDEAPYLEFVASIERAHADAEARNVAIIQKAAITGTWQAAAWWLERTRPKKYARMEKAEITGPEGGAVRVDVSTEELERKIAKIQEKRAKQG